jgi:hypothetical protein
MEALVKVINEQWAVVMTAPAAFLAALALGALVGWFAAWIILKQRLRLAANQLKCGGYPLADDVRGMGVKIFQG